MIPDPETPYLSPKIPEKTEENSMGDIFGKQYSSHGNILDHFYFSYLSILEIQVFVNCGRRAPTIPEESFNEMLKVLDMRSISIKKHEWSLANMLPMSITTHKMFLVISNIPNFGHHITICFELVVSDSGFIPPDTNASPSGFNKNLQSTFWNLFKSQKFGKA